MARACAKFGAGRRIGPGPARAGPRQVARRAFSAVFAGTPNANVERGQARARLPPAPPSGHGAPPRRAHAPRDVPRARARELRRTAPEVRPRRAPRVPPLRHIRLRLHPRALRRLRPRRPHRLLVQGARPLSELRGPPHGEHRRAHRRSHHPRGSRSSVGPLAPLRRARPRRLRRELPHDAHSRLRDRARRSPPQVGALDRTERRGVRRDHVHPTLRQQPQPQRAPPRRGRRRRLLARRKRPRVHRRVTADARRNARRRAQGEAPVRQTHRHHARNETAARGLRTHRALARRGTRRHRHARRLRRARAAGAARRLRGRRGRLQPRSHRPHRR